MCLFKRKEKKTMYISAKDNTIICKHEAYENTRLEFKPYSDEKGKIVSPILGGRIIREAWCYKCGCMFKEEPHISIPTDQLQAIEKYFSKGKK